MKDRLTPEQSQRLIELGVDLSKASGVHYIDPYDLDDAIATNQPIFRFTDLLELIPKKITDHIGTYGLRMEFGECGWSAYYVDYGISGDDDEPYADGIFIAPNSSKRSLNCLCGFSKITPTKSKS